ncbi:MAG: hypothetical protein DCC49_02725 [Acidobacteria bacterium]|nr:MAG: hypothetical protein DCC49_02725 [Acidobacteriota bacterium]
MTDDNPAIRALPVAITPRLKRKVKLARAAANLSYWMSARGVRDVRPGRVLCESIDRSVARRMSYGDFVLTDAHGIPFFVRKGTFETGAYLHRPFEPATTRVFEQAVKPGAVVLDVGAQFGYFSLLAGKLAGPRGHVIAVEPVEDNLELLSWNVKFNSLEDRIAIDGRGLSDRRETLSMFIYQESDSHALYRSPDAKVRDEVQVDLIPGDELTGGKPVDVIKIDVEGHEQRVLSGLKETIAASRGLVLIAEYAPAYLERGGTDPAEYLDNIRSLGFKVQVIYEETGLTGPFTDKVLEGLGPRPNVNLLCVK